MGSFDMKKLWNNFKKQKKRTKFTIVSILNIEIFTIVCFVFVFCDKTLPDELIKWFFRAWTIELAILFGIKLSDKNDS
jgi:hypothetical protein